MRTQNVSGLLSLAALLALVACADVPTAPRATAAARATAPAARVTTIDLGVPAQLQHFFPRAVSESGVIVGQATGPGQTDSHAFRWERGVLTDLGPIAPGAWNTTATAINAAGDVVGYGPVADGFNHAFRWHNGVMTDLGTLGGGYSFASGINARGDVVGWTGTAFFPVASPRAFVWSRGVMTPLGMPPGGVGALANGINAAGDVVGWSWGSVYFHAAILWRHGVGTAIPGLGEGPSEAVAINARGDVAGWMYVPGIREQHAFLWRNGVVTDLGTLGGAYSFPTGINARGEVAGYSETAGGLQHAVLWKDGVMIDLAPEATYGVAQGINDAGEIVGTVGSGGAFRGVAWTVK